MPIDFPTSPTVGQKYIYAGVTYTYTAQGVWAGGAAVLAGGNIFNASATPPSSATPGDHWYDLTTGILSIYIYDGNSSQWVQVSPPLPDATTLYPPTHGRLTYVSATQLAFLPFGGGDRIKINGTIQSIPPGGITGLANAGVFVGGVAGQNLVANTTYLIFAFMNGAVVTADFRTGVTHSTSVVTGNVGVEVLNAAGPVQTHTLIGMCRTNASAQFVDAAANRGVLSWFNRRNIGVVGAGTAGQTIASIPLVELTVASRAFFLTWGEEHVLAAVSGYANNSAVGTVVCSVNLDSATNLISTQTTLPTGTYWAGMSTTFSIVNPVEGYHWITPFGSTNSGTSAFYVQCTGMIRG
jgi:hypothetical protein